MSAFNAKALRIGMLATFALVALQLVWHAWIAPPKPALFWAGIALAVVPLLPGLWSARTSLRRGVLISGIVSLFYFCHGVSEFWSGNAPRWLAAAEIGLTLIVIGALGWDVRANRRPRPSSAGETGRNDTVGT